MQTPIEVRISNILIDNQILSTFLQFDVLVDNVRDAICDISLLFH